MKLKLILLGSLLCLGLCGCGQLLEQEYLHTAAHTPTPAEEGNPSILRAENYQELVNGLIFFVSKGVEDGSIRLYVPTEGQSISTVEGDLDAACLEVVQEDALGAYSVEHIKYSLNPVISYYQADLQITYRRSREQVNRIVSATGTTAIRTELAQALSKFSTEQVLRISYFNEDEAFIQTLCEQAYYANPATALDLPDITVAIYPDSGRQRIVEILLDYHLSKEELNRRKARLDAACDEILAQLGALTDTQLILAAAQAVRDAGGYDPALGASAYHALCGGGADSQGLSLAMALVCQRLDLNYALVTGSLYGAGHMWLVVETKAGWRHLDLSAEGADFGQLALDAQLLERGYTWERGSVPSCVDGDS